MKLKLIKGAIAALALSVSSTAANASLLFSDVDLTSNSISFMVDGVLDDITPDVGTLRWQLSILYSPSLWLGSEGSFHRNNISQSLFDNRDLGYSGNTGLFYGATVPYTWINFTGDLFGASANSRLVTIDFTNNYIDTEADGFVEFIWGNGYRTSVQTPIQSVAADPMPSPPSVALIFTGLLALLPVFRRKRDEEAA